MNTIEMWPTRTGIRPTRTVWPNAAEKTFEMAPPSVEGGTNNRSRSQTSEMSMIDCRVAGGSSGVATTSTSVAVTAALVAIADYVPIAPCLRALYGTNRARKSEPPKNH